MNLFISVVLCTPLGLFGVLWTEERIVIMSLSCTLLDIEPRFFWTGFWLCAVFCGISYNIYVRLTCGKFKEKNVKNKIETLSELKLIKFPHEGQSRRKNSADYRRKQWSRHGNSQVHGTERRTSDNGVQKHEDGRKSARF
jgi:hypothetical protein